MAVLRIKNPYTQLRRIANPPQPQIRRNHNISRIGIRHNGTCVTTTTREPQRNLRRGSQNVWGIRNPFLYEGVP